VNVTLGLRNSRYVEIESGLEEGQQVIYAGYEALKENDPVVPTRWGPGGALKLPRATGGAQAEAGTVYTCPMHPEVRLTQPGTCPKCGMTLQPVKKGAAGAASAPAPARPASRAARAIYTCPMHPEVQSDHPGKCPKCGMDLVLKPTDARSSGSGGAR
jgi:hypothetical protein